MNPLFIIEEQQKQEILSSNTDNNNNKDTNTKAMLKCSYKSCNKIFRDSRSLKEHIWVHQGKKPYYCYLESCNKQFTRIASLRKHERIHRGEKPYVCGICSQSFSQGCNLTRHMNTHQKERQFKCQICNKVFLSSANLKQHKIVHYDKEERQKHSCEICGKMYFYKNSLKKHMEDSHSQMILEDNLLTETIEAPIDNEESENSSFLKSKITTNEEENNQMYYKLKNSNISQNKLEKMNPYELHQYLHYHMHYHTHIVHNDHIDFLYQGELYNLKDNGSYEIHILEITDKNPRKCQKILDLVHYSDLDILQKLYKQILADNKDIKEENLMSLEICNTLTCYCSNQCHMSTDKANENQSFSKDFTVKQDIIEGNSCSGCSHSLKKLLGPKKENHACGCCSFKGSEKGCLCKETAKLKHYHGESCGHIPIKHGNHIDYIVDGKLHHSHDHHCDDHGDIPIISHCHSNYESSGQSSDTN